DRGADRRPAPTTPAGAPAGPDGTAGAGDQRSPRTALLLTWRPERDCGSEWTADLRARAYGPDQPAISQVTASVTGGAPAGTVTLSRDGASWVGALGGLPTGRTVTLTVRAEAADGSTVDSVSRTVTHTC
ncbi:MAG: hypothetical protein ACJ73E_01105, partial [Mycobacteriales bacterium]